MFQIVSLIVLTIKKCRLLIEACCSLSISRLILNNILLHIKSNFVESDSLIVLRNSSIEIVNKIEIFSKDINVHFILNYLIN